MDNDRAVKLARLTETMAKASLLGIELILQENGLDKDNSMATSLILNTHVLTLALATEAKARGIMTSELLKLDKSEYPEVFEDANQIAAFIFDEILSKKNPGITMVKLEPSSEEEGNVGG